MERIRRSTRVIIYFAAVTATQIEIDIPIDRFTRCKNKSDIDVSKYSRLIEVDDKKNENTLTFCNIDFYKKKEQKTINVLLVDFYSQ